MGPVFFEKINVNILTFK